MKIKLYTTLLLVGSAIATYAQPLSLPVSEMVSVSDNIYIGTASTATVTKNEKNYPTTTVAFTGIESAKTLTNNFDIVYAGGTIDGKTFEVSHSPVLEEGTRYLIFASDRERKHFSPISGHSGLLKLVKDEATNEEYISLDERLVVGLNNGKIQTTSKKVAAIYNGVPQFIETENAFKTELYSVNAIGATQTSDVSIIEQNPITLTTFKNILASQYNQHFTTVANNGNPTKPNTANKTTASLYECGYQVLPIQVVQLPSSTAPYNTISSQCLSTWNEYMSIFQPLAATGTFGSANGDNEFGGFPSSAALNSEYGYSWSTGVIAVTLSISAGGCGQIYEADIFANPAMSFTDNAWDQVSGSAFVYRVAILHELGHAWGFMRGGTETYDYGLPTVMQGGTYGIYESGQGVHAVDANTLRKKYTSQTPVINKNDLGIESYYAVDGTGLLSSTLSKFTVNQGSNFDVRKVTLENMSPSELKNIAVTFYASTDLTFDASDYKLGNTFLFTKMSAESYAVQDFTVDVPANVPAGKYYIAATIKYDTVKSDVVTGNNTTFFPNTITIKAVPSAVGNINPTGNITVAKMEDNGHYMLQYSTPQKGTARLFNAMGQLVNTQSLEEKHVYLPATGMYMLEVTTADNNKQMFKLVNY